jgi:dGTPase
MTWLRREDQETRERASLAPCAAFSDAHGGRRLPESEDPLRTAFQRDRDRVIHSAAFRRLQHKTQVFAADEGDHYRSRMTHSLEVSQMARSAALALRLNVDLAEAVALAHDLGHPPFGHVGEDALHELMRDAGGFRHNAQGVRIVDVLEDRHGHGNGLNLTRATRLSLMKGTIPDGFPLSADLLPPHNPPLEAVLVDRCDKIAYICHDLDDAIRAGLVSVQDAAELGLWKRAEERTGSAMPSRVYSEMVAIQVHDLVNASHEALTLATDDRPTIQHSDDIRVQSQELLAFLRTNFYRSDRVLEAMNVGRQKIEACFRRFLDDPRRLPETVQARINDSTPHRVVCDYVAGMTDRFLMRA